MPWAKAFFPFIAFTMGLHLFTVLLILVFYIYHWDTPLTVSSTMKTFFKNILCINSVWNFSFIMDYLKSGLTVSLEILSYGFIQCIHSKIMFMKALTGHRILISPRKVKLSDLILSSPPPCGYPTPPPPSLGMSVAIWGTFTCLLVKPGVSVSLIKPLDIELWSQ